MREETKKDAYEVDVLIVGYGAAGANAAIAAHDAGARVLILEKLSAGGGNSAVCAGAMVVPENLDAAIAYYRALAGGTVGEEMILAFAEAMMGIPDLLSRLGVEYKIEPSIPPTFPSLASGRLKQMHISPTGENGFRLLDRMVRQRNIEILPDTRVQALIQHPETGEVLGARARHRGQDLQLLARQGVVLACGGYGCNPEMLANFNLPGATDYIFPWGSPGNTGDGIVLASEAGAALWHMNALEWGRFCARAPSRQFGTAIGYGLGLTRRAGSYMFVNRRGSRFMAEDGLLSHCKSQLDILRYDHDKARFANLPAFMVFDHAHLANGPIAPTAAMLRKKRGGVVGYALVNRIYDWSADNQAEIAAGWVMQADSLAALADRIGAPAEVLEETVRQFNLGCRERHDHQFGRSASTLASLGAPPYFAVELGLSLVNTQGGPKRNVHGQVLDHRDAVIPRLYAAGELGSFFGFLYQIGSNYPEAWAFGQIAGARAAAEPRL
ncbi:FAD binding domain-containing protein [Duganella sp. CF458]|uniref:FAD-dependent oxidoreductase n=1 Tax=Duganella sp. CF458 TaxID=1884368 RepID=UPI0008EE1307|nr:FAD-binding protein [Duganella sp. CF458]SFG39778.1 FAD binding domain-containing protein [Duganella sp. CF458]